jgi:formylglycine-generating enzyme required for sulfatase activity
MKFVYIAPGTFTMGSPPSEYGRDDSETQHQVTLTKGFYLQATEVTQGQWKKIMGNNPSFFLNCGDDCPVERVNWNDAKEFIKRLNQQVNRRIYRLPTESEWEYAGRGGQYSPYYIFPWGNDSTNLSIANWPSSGDPYETGPYG